MKKKVLVTIIKATSHTPFSGMQTSEDKQKNSMLTKNVIRSTVQYIIDVVLNKFILDVFLMVKINDVGEEN
jgi:hypothetical protein